MIRIAYRLTEFAAMTGPANLWTRVRIGASDECWPFMGSLNKEGGYGHISVGGRLFVAHRVAWTAANGPIPAGMLVLHRCDNPPCCNPAHLFLGTHADNMADMASKGRRRGIRAHRGEETPTSKLITADVLAIRRRRAAGEFAGVIAADYGVSDSLIYRIEKRRVWADV